MRLTWHAEWAWLSGPQPVADVLIEVDDGRISRVEVGVPAPDTATRLAGLTLPGLANAHSHAFHRALRGRTHTGAGDFWSWRDQMYSVASTLDPDSYYEVARACYREMAQAGITAVGEFHYLHHRPDGRPYADPNAMAEALRLAAADAGIRLTLLDTLYLRSGVDDERLDPVQVRFNDNEVERWTNRVGELAKAWYGDPAVKVGVAVHSVRAVDPDSIRTAASYAGTMGMPLHIHVSEQPAENEQCTAVHGMSPTELLSWCGALGPATTAVHATHLTDRDVTRLAESGTTVCLCPTTERDLADGIGPARAISGAGIALSLGSDSHAMIDIFEEARAAELDERLASGTRGGLSPEVLLGAATAGGHASVGWSDGGAIEPGRLGDFITLRLDSVRLDGIPAQDLLAGAVFAATASDVANVVVGGRTVIGA